MSSLLKTFLLAAISQKPGEENCYWEWRVGFIKQQIKERGLLRKKISLPPSSVYSVFISNVSTLKHSWSLWTGKHWQVSSTALLSHFFRAVPLFIPDWKSHIFISVYRFLLLSERYCYFLSVTPSLENWSRRCCSLLLELSASAVYHSHPVYEQRFLLSMSLTFQDSDLMESFRRGS